MILRTLVVDPWNPRDGRETEWLPVTGQSLRDYLPPECVAPDLPDGLFIVAHNGRRLPPDAWARTIPSDGDGIVVSLRPLGVETLILVGLTVVINATIIWYESKRATLTAHDVARRAAAAAQTMADSMTYGWHGIQNTTEPGRPIPVLYGRHRIGGHVVYAETRLGTTQSTLDMMLVVSEGEVEGPDGLLSTTAEINGKPLSNYSGVTVGSRNGTLTQSTIPILWPAHRSVSAVAVGAALALNTSATAITAPSSDAYEVVLTLNSLVLIKPTGLQTTGFAEFEFRVRHRLLPSGAFVTSGTFKTGTLQAAASGGTAPYTHIYKTPTILALGQYEIEVTLIGITIPIPGGGFQASVAASSVWRFATLRSFTAFGPEHPGRALLAFTALPNASLSGALPTVTSIWKGRKIGVWNGDTPATFTENFTVFNGNPGQNPAWCGLDVLRSKTYGAGQHFDVDKDVDLPSVVETANFCDTLVSRGVANPIKSGSGTGTTPASAEDFSASGSPNFTDGTVRPDDTLQIFGGADAGSYRIKAINSATSLAVQTGTPPFATVAFIGSSGVSWEVRATERRAKCDHYFDGSTTIWAALEAIATNARFAVVRTNGRIKFVPDTRRTLSQIFGMGNVRNYKHQYLGGARANRFEGQFLDEEKNWEQQVADVEDPEVQAGVKPQAKITVECFGVTRKTQVLRILRYNMLSNRLEDQVIEFETDAMALAVEYGDVIAFTHDVMPRKQAFFVNEPLESGRVLAGSTTSAVKLDRPVVWSSHNRRINIQSLADDVIRNIRSEEADGTTSDFPSVTGLGGYTPAEGDVWTTEPEFIDSPPPNQWKVVAITRSQDHDARVRAVIYRDEMFDRETGVDVIRLPTT